MAKNDAPTGMVPFVETQLPAHMVDAGGLGNEGVETQDLAIPRLNLLQQLSPQLNKTKAEFVAGAEAGMFINSVTNELFEFVYVINLFYRRTIATFKKREAGGGFGGNYSTMSEAKAALIAKGESPELYDFVETANHYCLLLDEEGKPRTPVILSMSNSKLRVSNQWNSQIMLRGDTIPRFSSVWKLTAVGQSNTKGSWHNIHVDYVGYAPESLFNEAKDLYEQLKNAPEHQPEGSDAEAA